MDYSIEEIRRQFPSLQRQHNGNHVAYFDGPGGTQVAETVQMAMINYMKSSVANLHGPYPTSKETESIVDKAREAVSDLIGARPEEVAFGPNMTTLAFSVSRALIRQWQGEGEIVVTELDHLANVDPWISAAEDFGLKVKWLEVDPESLTLKTEQLEEVITEKTKLVAVGLASNVVGTISDVETIAEYAKQKGALVAVDAVHAVPHLAVDMNSIGADVLFCSAYKFFGPHIGIAAIRKEIFEPLQTYKAQPAPNEMPEKLETGTKNFEGLAGVIAAVDFIANLGEGETRRQRIVSGYEKIETYENKLASKLREELAEIEGVHVYVPDSKDKTPTVSFRLAEKSQEEVCQYFVDKYGIYIGSSHFYASTLAEKLGIIDQGSWIRAGIAPYNTEEEIDRLIKAVQELS